jgi:hypothetical protein
MSREPAARQFLPPQSGGFGCRRRASDETGFYYFKQME